MLKILIFSGSARKRNYTQHVADLVLRVANNHPEIKAILVSPQSLNLQFNDEGEGAKEHYPELTKKVADADGYVIVAPEYNHGYSGSLKYVLDLHLKEYIHKPVAFTGVSSGPWGGTRMIEHLTSIVREMGMVATFTDLNITHVKDEIVDGSFKNLETWEKRAQRMITELIWMAKVLKHGRENVPSEHQE